MNPQHAGLLRAAIFLGGLALLLLLEILRPRRAQPARRAQRWPANLGLAAIDSALVAATSLSGYAAAWSARSHDWGLFNHLAWPGWLAGACCCLVFDAAIYGQHRLLHAWPLLWPLHRPHHTDVELDATSALRFHPAEILLSQLWKISVVMALGAPPLAVLVFEITLNACAMFNHANIAVPGDIWLRQLVVTPDMHRVHHSVHVEETNSNYAFCLPLWDHLFRSYRAQPHDGHPSMDIGLPDWREPSAQRLVALLLQPFAGWRHRPGK